jgi:hypothetical protein
VERKWKPPIDYGCQFCGVPGEEHADPMDCIPALWRCFNKALGASTLGDLSALYLEMTEVLAEGEVPEPFVPRVRQWRETLGVALRHRLPREVQPGSSEPETSP